MKAFQSYVKGNKQFEIILAFITDSYLWTLSKLQKEDMYRRP